jgi:hypothetical protein
MSWAEDEGFDAFDFYDGDEYADMNIECKFCGVSGLFWDDMDGQWRLFETKTGGLHCCVPRPKNDFEVWNGTTV